MQGRWHNKPWDILGQHQGIYRKAAKAVLAKLPALGWTPPDNSEAAFQAAVSKGMLSGLSGPRKETK